MLSHFPRETGTKCNPERTTDRRRLFFCRRKIIPSTKLLSEFFVIGHSSGMFWTCAQPKMINNIFLEDRKPFLSIYRKELISNENDGILTSVRSGGTILLSPISLAVHCMAAGSSLLETTYCPVDSFLKQQQLNAARNGLKLRVSSIDEMSLPL